MGGGGQPTQTTAYNTNIPEYAEPYVMNMLGAGQNQLFTTTPGANGEPGEITGFRPYQAYSSNPQDYFAGPSSLQTSAYNAAGQLQTPSQYQVGTSLAGTAGLGQLGTANQAGAYGAQGVGLGQLGAMSAMPAFGAGQQYARQVTDPNAISQYMSPYQQQVTDVAKAAAVREAQIANQAGNLASARSGTYGGARQALAQAERERGLLSNLSNIQATGNQNAYNQAIQNMQYGSNLGLQGIQTGLQGISAGMQGVGQGLQGVGAQQAGYAGAGQAASTLGQLGSSQNQTDLANIGLQNQLGQQQQQYQQGIINQAIQDYATAQQYPYMQLSTMSNLLRGLPMQGMSTQQYQAQPSALQQGIGLLGTGASLYGAMKREGGQIKAYKTGGPVGLGYANRGVVDSMRDRLEEMADTDPKGLAKLVGQTKSKELKDIGNEILSGIATANTGKLGTNMAGGGIVAFDNGGEVPRFDGEYGSLINDPMGLQNDSQPGYGFSVGSLGDILGALGTEEEWQKALRLKKHGIEYTPKKGFDKEGLPIGSRFSKEGKSNVPTAAETAAFTETPDNKGGANVPPSDGNKGDGAGGKGGESMSGLQAYLDQRKKLLGIDGPGEKSQAFMKALEERQAGMSKERDADRYLRAAEAFAKFGSTAGPMLSGASQALGGFAKGEAAARKEEDKLKMEGMKMQSDLEKAQRAEARGDLDAAEKFYNSAQDRANRLEVAQIGASAAGQSTQLEREAIERYMKENPNLSYSQAYQAVKGAGRTESVDMQIASKAYTAAQASVAPGGANAKTYRKLLEQDPSGAAAEQFVNDLAKKQIAGMKTTMGLGSSGGAGGSGKVIDFSAIK